MVGQSDQPLVPVGDTSVDAEAALSVDLEMVKKCIVDDQTVAVSFDVFDTLVTRPFLLPSDMFYLLDETFKALDKQFRLQNFHDIRIESEAAARAEESDMEDVSLAQIYDVMQKKFFVNKNVADKMLLIELDYELRYCSQRKTAKVLYDLAANAGKKIIITSDMYLPVGTLEAILLNCGYKDYDKLYVSSHHGTMKATQNLYKHIADDLRLTPNSILHIGDNYESDVTAAKGAGWKAIYFPKGTEAWSGAFDKIFGEDAVYAKNHLGITTAYAIAANTYFDNPFRSFQQESIYNGSPYLIGYFALGLSMLGFTRWMVEDMKAKGISSVIFLGRDGHLPMRVFESYKQEFKLPMTIHYLPTSRKAIIPLALFSQANITDIQTFNYLGRMNDGILASLKSYIKDGAASNLESLDYKKLDSLRAAFVDTYKSYLGKKTAIVDVGYSGRPEQLFQRLFNVPLETYFIYSNSDEAKHRLGKTINIYSRLKVAAIREKMISEIGPSCTGYGLVNGRVEPIYDEKYETSDYEKHLLSNIQQGTTDFIQAYLGFFGDHLDQIDLGDNYLTMQPLDRATLSPTVPDREIYRGILHEDDIAGDGAISVFDQYYGNLKNMEADEALIENRRLRDEISTHMGIKRSAKLLAGNIKRRFIYGKDR